MSISCLCGRAALSISDRATRPSTLHLRRAAAAGRQRRLAAIGGAGAAPLTQRCYRGWHCAPGGPAEPRVPRRQRHRHLAGVEQSPLLHTVRSQQGNTIVCSCPFVHANINSAHAALARLDIDMSWPYLSSPAPPPQCCRVLFVSAPCVCAGSAPASGAAVRAAGRAVSGVDVQQCGCSRRRQLEPGTVCLRRQMCVHG